MLLALADLMTMDRRGLREIVRRGHPIPEGALDDTQYLGVDLSLPRWVQRHVLWQTFRKTFHRDPERGVLRGWNVRMQQNGVDGEQVPLRNKRGEPITFGHYHLRSGEGVRFPGGITPPHVLDYGVAGNTFFDQGRLGYTPLVAVNEGSASLLLGWEVFKVAGVKLPIPDYWALRLQGPLEQIIPPPREPSA